MIGSRLVHYGYCQVFGSGWDACGFGGGGPELILIAVVLFAVAVVYRW